MAYDKRENGFDLGEVLRRSLQFLILGFAVSIVAYVLPGKKLKVEEIITLGVTAAASYAVLSVVDGTMYRASKLGSGLALGAGLAGGF